MTLTATSLIETILEKNHDDDDLLVGDRRKTAFPFGVRNASSHQQSCFIAMLSRVTLRFGSSGAPKSSRIQRIALNNVTN